MVTCVVVVGALVVGGTVAGATVVAGFAAGALVAVGCFVVGDVLTAAVVGTVDAVAAAGTDDVVVVVVFVDPQPASAATARIPGSKKRAGFVTDVPSLAFPSLRRERTQWITLRR